MLSTRLDKPTLAFGVVLLALVASRIATLMLTPLELQFDEAQYWFWSRTLDWGYFSKPPLIAWAISATTSLFGNAEWAVRLAAPLAHGAASVALFMLARNAYSPWAGFWAGIGWLLMPAVWLSSHVISTDALLLPLWALGLLALWRFYQTSAWAWAITLGAAIGLGLLTKYAMAYFFLCAAIAAIWIPALRARLLSLKGFAALAISLAFVAPNLAWNASNHFSTIEHTAANASSSGFGVHPNEFFEFLSAQLAVFGPIPFIALIWLAISALRRPSELKDRDKAAIAFAAPPLLIICAQAMLSHAHANWAVTAYPAAILWLAGRLSEVKLGRLTLIAAAATQILLCGIGTAGLLNSRFADSIGAANALEDGRGWRVIAHETATRARALGPFSAVSVDHRALFFELTYYWALTGEKDLPPLRMWVLHADARNHAEATAPLTPANGARVLLVQSQPRYEDELAGDFTKTAPIVRIQVDRGATDPFPILFAIGENFTPAPRDAAFEARIGD
ncbi:MAG: glycosyltransferase family 39 protein [Caulobacterales bacterium]